MPEVTTTPFEESSQGAGPRNYFGAVMSDPDALKYRLEGNEVIKKVVDTLRGGIVESSNGKITYREEFRLMSEEGIARVEMFLNGSVNKVVHLTKYKNENRILTQVRELAKAFLFELTANMKRWGPTYTTDVQEYDFDEWARKNGVVQYTVLEQRESTITVLYRIKVRNKMLVQHVVENAVLASLQRGEEGFENINLGKTYSVNEIIDRERRRESEQSGMGRFNLFSQGGQ